MSSFYTKLDIFWRKQFTKGIIQRKNIISTASLHAGCRLLWRRQRQQVSNCSRRYVTADCQNSAISHVVIRGPFRSTYKSTLSAPYYSTSFHFTSPSLYLVRCASTETQSNKIIHTHLDISKVLPQLKHLYLRVSLTHSTTFSTSCSST